MLDNIREVKLQKLQNLINAGLDPYPSKSRKDFPNSYVLEKFSELSDKEIFITGRIRSLRQMGALIFLHIEDESAKIQVLFKKETIGDEKFDLFLNNIDIGDFIEVGGKLFLTKTNEKTLEAKEWKILSKALLPLPTEFYGIKDQEERLRKRYLDILFNKETAEIVKKKSVFWNAVREFHTKHGFLEVETPVLETTTGGADANPFSTHHNALDMDVYLRISAGELWQKRLMVAGLEKTFEIGRIFRNEGISAEHAQDYTQCEAYWAYGDYKDMYNFLRECYQYVAEKTFGTLKFKIRDFDIDLSGEWPLVDYSEEIKKQTGIDIWKASDEDIKNKLDELKVEYDVENKERLIDSLWKYCRKNIGGPVIIINEPKITSPLSKSIFNNPDVVERFHFVIAGSELGQGYSELNNPIDQKERFEKQQSLREAGDEEAQMADYDFIEALEYGMPPTCGHGFSERLFSFLMDKPIRECQIFPLMRPQDIKGSDFGKSKTTKIAVALINDEAHMQPWEEMNTIAHLNAAFGARTGKSLLYQDSITTKDNRKIKLNIQHAIIVKRVKSNKEILDIIKDAKENELEISEFIKEMVETSDDKKIIEWIGSKKLDEVMHYGALIFGNKSIIDKLTEKFELYK